MPHIMLETAGDFISEEDINPLLLSLHKLVSDIAEADINSCKSRLVQHQQYCIGEGKKDSHFLHLTIKLLTGRTTEQLDTLGDAAFKLLKLKFGALSHNIDITVLVEEMIKQNYYKD